MGSYHIFEFYATEKSNLEYVPKTYEEEGKRVFDTCILETL